MEKQLTFPPPLPYTLPPPSSPPTRFKSLESLLAPLPFAMSRQWVSLVSQRDIEKKKDREKKRERESKRGRERE